MTEETPRYRKSFPDLLEDFYRLGREICKEIDGFQPDVLLGLLHSGWGAVVAAQSVWEATRQTPFLPTARANIGREKDAIYRAEFPHKPPAFCCIHCSEDGQLAHLLLWLEKQTRWQDDLLAHLILPLGDGCQPKRILVVDELFHGGGTCYIALKLLELAFPGADVRYIGGSFEWLGCAALAWMEKFTPPLYNEAIHNSEIRKQNQESKPSLRILENEIKPLLTGTEDLSPESLGWKRVDENSPVMQTIAGCLTPAEALASIPWMFEQIAAYARSRALQAPGEAEPTGGLGLIERRKIDATLLALMQAWNGEGLTFHQICQIGEMSRGKARRWLRRQLYFGLMPQGFGRATRYIPQGIIPSWVEKTGLEFYSISPEQLYIGQYPDQIRQRVRDTTLVISQTELIKSLLDLGFTCFVDLTSPDEPSRWGGPEDDPGLLPYADMLSSLSSPGAKQPVYARFPLKQKLAPDAAEVKNVLDYLDAQIASGAKIYLHSSDESAGRAPLIAACWLVRHGWEAKEALQQIMKNSRETVLLGYRRKPETETQYRFIMHWVRLTASRSSKQ